MTAPQTEFGRLLLEFRDAHDNVWQDTGYALSDYLDDFTPEQLDALGEAAALVKAGQKPVTQCRCGEKVLTVTRFIFWQSGYETGKAEAGERGEKSE